MLIYFLFLNKNKCCGYSLEAPRRGASNEYPQYMYLSRNKKNIMWIPPLICSYGRGRMTVDLFHDLSPWKLCGRAWLRTCNPWICSETHHQYSRTSMARTSLGSKKIVRDMGRSSHWGLIMVPGQEANSDNLGNFFSIFYTIIIYLVHSLESPRWGDSNEYTQRTIPW